MPAVTAGARTSASTARTKIEAMAESPMTTQDNAKPIVIWRTRLDYATCALEDLFSKSVPSMCVASWRENNGVCFEAELVP